MKKYLSSACLALAVAAVLPIGNANAAEANLDCNLKFSLTGWSAILKHSEGHGVITCENGQKLRVNISAKGAGLTVGKSHIDDGKGRFTDVHNITETLGDYAQGEAHIGAGKSGNAQVLTKGTVSLALSGTGEGIDIGIDVGKFTISAEKKSK